MCGEERGFIGKGGEGEWVWGCGRGKGCGREERGGRKRRERAKRRGRGLMEGGDKENGR